MIRLPHEDSTGAPMIRLPHEESTGAPMMTLARRFASRHVGLSSPSAPGHEVRARTTLSRRLPPDFHQRPPREEHRQEPAQRSPRDPSSGARGSEREGCWNSTLLLPRYHRQGLAPAAEPRDISFRIAGAIALPTSIAPPILGPGSCFRIRTPHLVYTDNARPCLRRPEPG